MKIFMTAGETAMSNKREIAYTYFDERAEHVGLPKTTGIYVFTEVNDYEDYDDFLLRHCFLVAYGEDKSMILLPRQLDYIYDVEQYRDVLGPEHADILVEWFRAQKQIDDAFTYYVENTNELLFDVLSCPTTEEYMDCNRFRLVHVATE